MISRTNYDNWLPDKITRRPDPLLLPHIDSYALCHCTRIPPGVQLIVNIITI